MKNIKIALICTIGGHFEQLINLKHFYTKYEHFWATNKGTQTINLLSGEKYYWVKNVHFTRPYLYFIQIPQFIKILLKEKPSHILSTGSGTTCLVPFFLSKLLKIKFIYIDTFSRVKNLTKFGNLLFKLNQPVLTQWIKDNYPGLIYIGPVLENSTSIENIKKEDFIFITLGNRSQSFVRLIKTVEELLLEGIIGNKVIVQAGFTKYFSNNMEIFDFCSPEKIDEYISKAKYVITQESAGIATKCLRYNTKFIEMPRQFQYKELPTSGDMDEDLQYKLEKLGYTKVVNDKNELKEAIGNLNNLRTGFTFDNSFAITKLINIIENK